MQRPEPLREPYKSGIVSHDELFSRHLRREYLLTICDMSRVSFLTFTVLCEAWQSPQWFVTDLRDSLLSVFYDARAYQFNDENSYLEENDSYFNIRRTLVEMEITALSELQSACLLEALEEVEAAASGGEPEIRRHYFERMQARSSDSGVEEMRAKARASGVVWY